MRTVGTMPEKADTRNDLIRFRDIFLARLMLLPRLRSIKRTVRHVMNIDAENRESWGSLLEENARRFPLHMAVKSEEAFLTYEEYNGVVNQYANYLLSQGVKKGDTVVLFLENRPELLIAYSANAKVGAINCMINTNLRGESLLHCLTLNPATVFIVGEEVLDAFEEVHEKLKLQGPQKAFFVQDRGNRPAPAGFIDLKEAVKECSGANPPTTLEVKPRDPIAFVFTSGTTGGMPKAAVITHRRVVSGCYFTGRAVMNIKPNDTIYVPLPFFHTNALALSWPCTLANGAAVAIRRKFSASRFWDDVRKYNGTIFCYVGECCRYLMNQPPRPDDRSHPLRTIIGNGLRPEIWKQFKKRFGITRVLEIYGAAESNLFFINLFNLDCTVGTCVIPYAIVKYDVDAEEPIRDENGFMQRVDVGEAGLLLGEITDRSPFSGYTRKEATEAKILRDVFQKGDAWFNSGDLVRDIGYGHAQFVDRLGDTFRWKGENVSTTEVEQVANTFPQVEISMVYGVVMPGSDGRAGMAAIIANCKLEEFDFKGLAKRFREALPSYAVPKFIRFKADFDYTPTHKIKKTDAKREGFDPAVVTDPIFVLLPGADGYVRLTPRLYEEIMANKYKF
ncbi:MAG: long-chain-acyl-CoA synthetase [Candidatus Abyssubacteria bacterium]